VSQQVLHDKDPSLLKGAEHRPTFRSPSSVMVTSSYKWKNSWVGRKTVNNQSSLSDSDPIIWRILARKRLTCSGKNLHVLGKWLSGVPASLHNGHFQGWEGRNFRLLRLPELRCSCDAADLMALILFPPKWHLLIAITMEMNSQTCDKNVWFW
jgi:hypothetical protein